MVDIPRTQLDWGLRFAEQITYLRHVHGIGWHSWDGTRWRPDDNGETGRVYADMIKDTYPELPRIGDPRRPPESVRRPHRRREAKASPTARCGSPPAAQRWPSPRPGSTLTGCC